MVVLHCGDIKYIHTVVQTSLSPNFSSPCTEVLHPFNRTCLFLAPQLPENCSFIISMNLTTQGTSFKWNHMYFSYYVSLISLNTMSTRASSVAHQ